tara:strand:+ start:1498 stop:2112 length:615 start_codon:yes stop_codon:yes gene_type:complete
MAKSKSIIITIFTYLLISLTIFIPSNTQLDTPIKQIFSLIFLASLMHVSFEDIKTMHIPQKSLIIGSLFGLILTIANLIDLDFISSLKLLSDHLIAIVSSYFILISINSIGKLTLKKVVLGIGDAKLTAMCSIWIGTEAIFTALSIAFLVAGIYSTISKGIGRLSKSEPFPFAPFICGGVWGVWITGPKWWLESIQSLLGSLMV